MALVNAFGALALDSTIAAAIKVEDVPAVSGDSGIAPLVVRQLTDGVATSADGDYSHLYSDEEGRLKVSTKPATFPDTSAGMTAISSLFVDVSRASNVAFHLKNTGTVTMTTGTFIFEASLDSSNGSDGTWFGIQALRSNTNLIDSSTGVTGLTAATGLSYSLHASVAAYKYFRIRCSVVPTTSSVATWTIIRGSYATEPVPGSPAVPSQIVVGPGAHAVAISGNPVRLAGRAVTSDYSPVTAGTTADLKTTISGSLVVYPYATPDNTWSYAAAAGGIVVATAVTVKASGGAGIRNYITGAQFRNSSGNQSEIMILDGSTVIWRSQIVAGTADGINVTFNPPLRGTAATLVAVQCSVTGAAIYANLQGFVSAA